MCASVGTRHGLTERPAAAPGQFEGFVQACRDGDAQKQARRPTSTANWRGWHARRYGGDVAGVHLDQQAPAVQLVINEIEQIECLADRPCSASARARLELRPLPWNVRINS